MRREKVRLNGTEQAIVDFSPGRPITEIGVWLPVTGTSVIINLLLFITFSEKAFVIQTFLNILLLISDVNEWVLSSNKARVLVRSYWVSYQITRTGFILGVVASPGPCSGSADWYFYSWRPRQINSILSELNILK